MSAPRENQISTLTKLAARPQAMTIPFPPPLPRTHRLPPIKKLRATFPFHVLFSLRSRPSAPRSRRALVRGRHGTADPEQRARARFERRRRRPLGRGRGPRRNRLLDGLRHGRVDVPLQRRSEGAKLRHPGERGGRRRGTERSKCGGGTLYTRTARHACMARGLWLGSPGRAEGLVGFLI